MTDQRPPGDLEVPDAAIAAYYSTLGMAPGDHVEWDRDTVRRMAAPVVAAELRRLIETCRSCLGTNDARAIAAEVFRRADELDGGA